MSPDGTGSRPTLRILPDPLVRRILEEARDLLREVGVAIAHPEAAELALSGGATGGPGERIGIGGDLIDRALESAPSSFRLHDRDGGMRADLGGMRVHFTPGSSATQVLDEVTGRARPPTTRDYVRHARLVEHLPSIDYPSTALVPADVPGEIADAYRLYLSLLYGSGPVVTGAFTVEGFRTMEELLLAVRESASELARKPLALFSCCPTAPLKWPDVTAKNIIDCARKGIPVELVSMPLTGFIAPGTLTGALVQHTAENLSGLVLGQLASPGAPVLWGGSPAVFDYRHETTPMGAVESQMLVCASAEIGKSLGLPTQGYILLSDAKDTDVQCGLESAAGGMLGALTGINSISGPGMLDFESCQSLEKLLVDGEICASIKRLLQGVVEREGDFPALPHFQALLSEGHSLIADHTRRWFGREVRFPGPVLDRASRARYEAEGSRSLRERARERIERLLEAPPNLIDDARRTRLDGIMSQAARAAGMERLPDHEA